MSTTAVTFRLIYTDVQDTLTNPISFAEQNPSPLWAAASAQWVTSAPWGRHNVVSKTGASRSSLSVLQPVVAGNTKKKGRRFFWFGFFFCCVFFFFLLCTCSTLHVFSNIKYWNSLGTYILLDLPIAEACRFYPNLFSDVHCSAIFFLVMRKLYERNYVTSMQVHNLSLSPKELCLLTCVYPITKLWLLHMNIALQSSFCNVFRKPAPLGHMGEVVLDQLGQEGKGTWSACLCPFSFEK